MKRNSTIFSFTPKRFVKNAPNKTYNTRGIRDENGIYHDIFFPFFLIRCELQTVQTEHRTPWYNNLVPNMQTYNVTNGNLFLWNEYQKKKKNDNNNQIFNVISIFNILCTTCNELNISYKILKFKRSIFTRCIVDDLRWYNRIYCVDFPIVHCIFMLRLLPMAYELIILWTFEPHSQQVHGTVVHISISELRWVWSHFPIPAQIHSSNDWFPLCEIKIYILHLNISWKMV